MLGAKSRQSLDIANNGLCYVNETEATSTNGGKYLLSDPCFIWKNQNFEANVLKSTLGVDHFTIVNHSSLKIDQSDKERQFLIRFSKKYSRSNFKCHAPWKLVESSTKKQQKQWLRKELRGLINENHRLFNAWKKNPKPEIYKTYKSVRNSENRKLKKTTKFKRTMEIQQKKDQFQQPSRKK